MTRVLTLSFVYAFGWLVGTVTAYAVIYALTLGHDDRKESR
jgi:predicted outer membrane lipoprotein